MSVMEGLTLTQKEQGRLQKLKLDQWRADQFGLGWDKMRLPNPVRPGDWLSLTMECIEKRESKGKLYEQ